MTHPSSWDAAFAHLGFGAAQLGNLYREVDDETARRAVDAAWDAGLRYFDTAPHYGLGLSERRLGAALRERPRDEYVLSTKVGRLLRPNPHPTADDLANAFAVPGDLTRVRDYSSDGVLTSLEESLQRLGLDRIDIVWIHDPEEPDDRFEECMVGAVPALEQLREAGHIGAWGVGSKDAEMVKRFVEHARPDLVMLAGRHTLLEQEGIGLVNACRERGAGIVDVGVFNSGLLARPRPSEDARYEYDAAPAALVERAHAIADVCERHGVTLPQAAIAYPRLEPAVVNVCLGMRTADHVASNVQLAETPVPQALWDELNEVGLLHSPEEN